MTLPAPTGEPVELDPPSDPVHIDLCTGVGGARWGVAFNERGDKLVRYAELSIVPATPEMLAEARANADIWRFLEKHGITLKHSTVEDANIPVIGEEPYESEQWAKALVPLAAATFQHIFPEAIALATPTPVGDGVDA